MFPDLVYRKGKPVTIGVCVICGLFGCYGLTLSEKDKEALVVLGDLSKDRGEHSTGIFTVERSIKKPGRFHTTVLKDMLDGYNFFKTAKAKELLDRKPFLIAGHTRFATHGTKVVRNAHPFSVGHLIGMHNGVIPALYDRENDRTDSEALFNILNAEGVVTGLRKLDELRQCDMAVVFLNKSNNTLNFFRDEGRPLHMAMTKKGTLFWASEKRMLHHIKDKFKFDYVSLVSLKNHLLNTIKLGHLNISTEDLTPRKMIIVNPPPSSSVPVVMGPVKKPEEPGVRVIGYKDSPWSFSAMKSLVQSTGCAYCNKKEIIIHKTPVHFFGELDFLCDDCYKTQGIIETFFQGYGPGDFYETKILFSSRGEPYTIPKKQLS